MKISDLIIYAIWLAIAGFYFTELYNGGFAAFVGYFILSCLLSTATMVLASLLFGVLIILPLMKLKGD